ncbi:MAG: ribosome biogenesis GTPase Der [Planctomycetes bacterium]|nr:ribosome biogenesis GTPase Der [Planctomycetota bacterium]
MLLPQVAIVGRPNVGKSSLLNRLVGRRVSIVEPTPGVTRDRVGVAITHRGRRLELVDTGGIGQVDEALLKEHVERQIRMALEEAELVVFVVDGKEGLVPADQMVAEKLRRLDKPVLLVANKVESAWDEIGVHAWLRLGFGEPVPVSAKEGLGCSEVLDRILAALPVPAPEAESLAGSDVLRFAVVGKRNSGKSTLINRLVGSERLIVSEIPGTTRDAVDVEFEHKGRQLLAIDTAGVRRKKSLQDAIEFFSYTRSTESIRRAHVVLHLFDITEPISEVDKKLAAYVVEHDKPVILVGNKADLADQIALARWDAYIKQQLPGLRFAPVAFVSAKEGFNVDETVELLFELRAQSRLQIPTPALNKVLQEAKTRLLPRSKSRYPKLFYGTQIGTEPIRILVFVNEPALFRGQYDRYLQNCLRERFECAEVPIQIVFRKREKVLLDPLPE